MASYRPQRHRAKGRQLRLERLESRFMLAGDATVAIELGILNRDREPVSQVELGEEFILRGRASDLREQLGSVGGVFAAYVDVAYDANLVSATSEIRVTDGFKEGGVRRFKHTWCH